jgi:type VI protein secretion system component VasK
MNWSNLLGLTLVALLMFFALLRVERKWLWAVVVLLIGPSLFLIWQWLKWRGAWPETLAAFGIAGVIAGGWWLRVGRKLPAPTSDSIKVWGQEAAPKPKPAEMQAELQKLRDENAQLEMELQRLKSGHNGQEK